MAMPISLAYMAIYNPTLLPLSQTDDEDAREHAHICFYTSREQAVSRDRMLRQVGLAKALVNFSGVFTAAPLSTCVEAQKTKLITVSPEADWWIHAAFELEHLPRAPPPLSKSKQKAKEDSLDRTQHDRNIQTSDQALKEHLLEGYEDFKLLHGSLSELVSKNRLALERDLERFFIVWVSRWGQEWTTKLLPLQQSVTLHPSWYLVAPLISSFAERLTPPLEVAVLSPPYVLHPTTSKIPTSLCRHVTSLFSSLSTLPVLPPSSIDSANNETSSLLSALSLPKKWSWSPYFSFGRSSSRQSQKNFTERPTQSTGTPVTPHIADPRTTQGIVDKDALVDALGDNVHTSKEGDVRGQDQGVRPPTDLLKEDTLNGNIVTQRGADIEASSSDEKKQTAPDTQSGSDQLETQAQSSFVTAAVHLPLQKTSMTQLTNALCLARGGLIIAIIAVGANDLIQPFGTAESADGFKAACNELLSEVETVLSAPRPSLEAAADEHYVMMHPRYAHIIRSSAVEGPVDFFSLYAQLNTGVVNQVFSRASQHWLVGESHGSSDFYMEVGRKDLNLTEVEKLTDKLIENSCRLAPASVTQSSSQRS